MHQPNDSPTAPPPRPPLERPVAPLAHEARFGSDVAQAVLRSVRSLEAAEDMARIFSGLGDLGTKELGSSAVLSPSVP